MGALFIAGGVLVGGWCAFDGRSTRNCAKPGLTKGYCFEWAGRYANEAKMQFGFAMIVAGLLVGTFLLMVGAYVQLRTQSDTSS